MKVVIHVDGPIIRGNERQVIRIAAGLQARGHQVVVSCRAGGPVQAELKRLSVPTTGIRPGGDTDLWNALRFARWLRRERPDVLLLTSWKRTFIAAWAARIARVPRVVFRLGGVKPLDEPRRWPARHALRRWCHAIIVNSRAVAELVTDSLPEMDPGALHVVANGIEPVMAHPAPLRQELRLPDGVILLGALGGLERNKRYGLIIQCLTRLDPRVHAILVGGGTETERVSLERLAERCGVADRVHLLGWRGDAPAILAACDLFVLSSRTEGMSVAMLEAMAAGIPVVATPAGGVWDALAPRDHRPAAGWMVPSWDVNALAVSVREVIAGLGAGSPEVRERVAEARWRIAHWFATDRMLDGYEAVLRGQE